MSYLVMARKWRPRNFEEVVGQPVVVRTLGNAIRTGRIAQAYLFCGTRGVGKTTVARILAKALNCEKGPTPEPCGECRPCRDTAEGRALDVIEMDAASHNGVDDIRQLQEHLQYKGFMRYKVVILDEAHMLSTAANNALLKTLEEPPPHVVFVLATTEPHKLEETVISRCQVFTFRRIDESEIHAHLRKIAESEKLEISDSTLDLLVRESEGSMRDAVVALDQLVAFVGSRIGDAEAAQALGAIERDTLHALMGAILKSDGAELLSLLQRLAAEGIHLPRLAMEFLWYLREMLVIRSTPEPGKLLHLSKRDLETMQALAPSLNEPDILRMMEIFSSAERDMRWSRQPRFLLESAFLKAAYVRRLAPIEDVLSRMGSGNGPVLPSAGPPSSLPGGRTAAFPAVKAARPAAAPPSPGGGNRGAQASAAGMAVYAIAEIQPDPEPPAPPRTPDVELTQKLLVYLDREQPLLAGLLEHAARWSWTDGALRVYFAPSRKAAKTDLEPRREAIAKAVREALGNPYEVQLLDLEPTEEDAEAEARKDDQTLLHEKLRLEAAKEPLVQRIMDRFKAHVVEVEKLEKA